MMRYIQWDTMNEVIKETKKCNERTKWIIIKWKKKIIIIQLNTYPLYTTWIIDDDDDDDQPINQ